MKNIKYIIIALVVIIISFFIFYSPICRLYNSFYINSESFKNSDLQSKRKYLENKDFINNSSEEEISKVVELIALDIINGDDLIEKIDLLNYPEFVLYGSLETREKLVESIIDSPKITDEDFISFLKACRSVDFEVVTKLFEAKKPTYSLKIVKSIKDFSNSLPNSVDKKIWDDVVKRSLGDIAFQVENRTQEAFESNDLKVKIALYKNDEFKYYASGELNEKLIRSIIESPDATEDDYFTFLFNICKYSDFNYASKLLEERWQTLDLNFVENVLKNIKNYNYNDEIWIRINNKLLEAKKASFKKSLKEVMDSKDFNRKLNYYNSNEFRKNSSLEEKKELLKSIVDIPGISDTQLRMLMVDCSRPYEITVIAKRIDENKIFFTQYLTATFVRFGYYKSVEAELAKRLIMSNPYAKKQVVEIAMDELKANNFKRMQDLGATFVEVFKIEPKSDLFNNVAKLYSLINKEKRNPSSINKEELDSKKVTVKKMMLEHFEKIYFEYDKEIEEYNLEHGIKPVVADKKSYEKKYGVKKGEKEKEKENVNFKDKLMKKVEKLNIKLKDDSKKAEEDMSSSTFGQNQTMIETKEEQTQGKTDKD